MKRVRVSRILGFVVVLFVITLFAGCGGGGGGGGGGDTKGDGEEITIPVITSQPDHQVVPLGGQAVFTVAATGGGLSYQWESSDDKGRTWDPISGATAASCSIPTSEQTPALFRCTVTNTAGSVTSDIVELAVVTVIFVDEDAAEGGDGSSWETAYTSLQDALGGHSDCEIWVADGTYTPTSGTDRSATFALVSGVAVYGGFTGGETFRQARDWKTNVTTLSGDIGTEGHASDNCYHVVTGATGATLDGFTITDGNANGSYPEDRGGGMYNHESSPTVTNCTFAVNFTSLLGGGMYNENSSPTVTDCTFSGNSANNGRGGGMSNLASSNPSVTNCTFSGNSANNGRGGGMSNLVDSNPTVTNCTFSGNSASSRGGAIDNHDNSNPTVRNSILWGNSAATGSQIYDDPGDSSTASSTTTITYSCIQGGSEGTIDSDPLLDDDPLSDGYLTLQEGSPCIDTGDNSAVPSGITTDLAGNPRISGASVDMGAYEYQQ